MKSISVLICWFLLNSSVIASSYFFRTKLKGSGVQNTGGPRYGGLYKFTVETSGNYKILKAWFALLPGETNVSSQEIIRTQIKGIEFQSFIPNPLSYITQFTVVTSGNYKVLRAHTADGQTGNIIRTRIKGIQLRGISAPEGIKEFVTTGGGEWKELGVVAGIATQFISWDCMYKDGVVIIMWTTGSEFNIDKWIVDRREENGDYTTICEKLSQSQGRGYYYEYIDSTVSSGTTYYYRLGKISQSDTTWHGEKKIKIPEVRFSFSVIPSVGKKFKINYSVPGRRNQLVSLGIYDCTGRLVKNLIDKVKKPGKYAIGWDAAEVSKGTYFVRFVATKEKTKKIVVVK